MIVVFGDEGMLGKAVIDELGRQDHDYQGIGHRECDILRPEDLIRVKKVLHPSIVINCAGDPNGGGRVNSLGPWYIARIFSNSTIVHVSTDCVYHNHDKVNVSTTVPALCSPNSTDEYQLSKMLGEQQGKNIVNVRTSFIGYEHGLLRWLLEQKPESVIQGWDNAFWSGSSVYEVARHLVRIAKELPSFNVLHLATKEVTTKYEILQNLIYAFKLDVKLEHSIEPVVLRGLYPDYSMNGLDNQQVMKELVDARPN